MDGGETAGMARSSAGVVDAPMAADTPPFIHVRMVDGAPRMSGVALYAAGHKIPRRDGAVDGVFAEWRWDGRSLSVANCRYGLRPLYFFARAGEIGVSTSIEQLLGLGAEPALDQEALAVFFRLNWFLAEDTPFKSIRLVPPAAEFTWDGGLRIASKLHIVRPSGLTRDAAIDGLIETFRHAVERRYVDGAIVPLSGGRDSRHTLYELCRIGRPRLCVTARDIPPYPNPNENTLYAALLARTFGIKHAVVDYIPDIVEAERRKNALTNFCSLEHAWFMQVHDRLDGEPGRVFDGLGGDYLAAGGGLVPKCIELMHAGRIDDLARHLLVRRHVASLDFLADETAFPFEAAYARVRRELERHLGAVNPIGSYYFWNRVRRGIGASSFGIMAAHDVAVPFVDHDVFDLLTSLPVDMFADRTFHTQSIHRAFPQFSHIPFESKRKTPASNPRGYLLRNWLKLLGHVTRHGASVVDRNYVAPRLAAYALLGKVKPVWYDAAAIYAIQLNALVARHAPGAAWPVSGT
jgi:asparagine synthase (glutamine-hydrolysing)